MKFAERHWNEEYTARTYKNMELKNLNYIIYMKTEEAHMEVIMLYI